MMLDERLVRLGLIAGADGGNNVSSVGSVGRQQCGVNHAIVVVVLQVNGGAAVKQRLDRTQLTT